MDLPTPSRPPATLAELQRSIVERIREFDVTALLDLLLSIGYDLADIELRGHMTACPQPTMIHSIALRGADGACSPGEAKVTITVNLGLLSCRSPLPSYLQRLCRALETSDPLLELLALLDRSLLRRRLMSDQPERMLAGWPEVRRDFLRIHGLDSPLGLHWLFRTVFPELGVRVRRQTDDYRVPFHAARLGTAALGRCAFGNTSRITVHDIEVTLVSAESVYEGRPWPRVAELRIRRFVLPLLDEVCMNLTIAFVLLDRSAYAQLSNTCYVGYDPLWEPRAPAAREDGLPPARIVLYRGALPRDEPGPDELEHALATAEHHPLQLETRRWDRPRTTRAAATPRGTTLALTLAYAAPDGRRYAYDVEVRWGTRAWFADEPFEISLVFEGMPKASPDPRQHPNLWLWLRNEARSRVANRLAIETMALEADAEERVRPELVERLIATGEHEQLHALHWSTLTPLERWEPAAWQRFLDWSEA